MLPSTTKGASDQMAQLDVAAGEALVGDPLPLPRRRGRPPRLSRPAILATALRLIDEESAQALTMRRLGRELNVEAMSLYRHISSKDVLLDGIAELLMSEIGVTRSSSNWTQVARDFATGIRAVARAHPAAFELVGLRALNTAEALRPVEALLASLRAGGLPSARAVAAYRLLASYARGFALIEIAGFTLDGSRARLTGEKLPSDEFPAIRSLSRALASQPTDAHFRAGVETIITGLACEFEAAG